MARRSLLLAAMVAGVACFVVMWGAGPVPAFGAEIVGEMPAEMKGFRGVLVAKVARIVNADDCIVVGDVKVNTVAQGKMTPAQLTAACKDKYITVIAKDKKIKFPEVAVGDWMAVECYQNEAHFRVTKASKVDPAKVGLEKPDSSKTAPGK